MREGDSLANPAEGSQAFGERWRGGGELVEADALHELHGVECPAVGQGSDIMDRHDTGMLEECDDSSLATHAGRQGAVRSGGDLYGDPAPKPRVIGEINRAHAASREPVEQTIAAPGEVVLGDLITQS